jgi:hypothetical protein
MDLTCSGYDGLDDMPMYSWRCSVIPSGRNVEFVAANEDPNFVVIGFSTCVQPWLELVLAYNSINRTDH